MITLARMSALLQELEVLVLDCQASGATPALGELLELGWGVTSATALVVPPQADWILPTRKPRVTKIVRELTGWSEACLATSLPAEEAWQRVRGGAPAETDVPTVIHFARFELAFLRELHGRTGDEAFPLDAICIHAVAERLFPDLPRRSLRALAGYLGHSTELLRRASGHVEATAFIWRALLPHLEERGVTTWDELKAWLDVKADRSRRTKRVFPMPASVRRALPDAPGVYRFLRSNGDVLYVGKATSLKKRVASHFGAGARTTERALEMLTQAHSIDATETASILEAALLETDEIKRLDPPYNVQLRGGERSAWFASHDWSKTASAPDPEHPVGPLPSRGALRTLAAVRAMLAGEEPTEALRAAAVDTTTRDAPEAEPFQRVWNTLFGPETLEDAAARLTLLRLGDRLPLPVSPTDAPPGWDEARIRRHLERAVVGGVTLIRRARLLSLLSAATVTYREGGSSSRTLILKGANFVSQAETSTERPPDRQARLRAFDAHRYDRLRILGTELRRVQAQGGDVRIQVGAHVVRLPKTEPSLLPDEEPDAS